MGELEEKLNAILGDPSAMGQIMSLAQSLGVSAPPSAPEEKRSSEAAAPEPEAPSAWTRTEEDASSQTSSAPTSASSPPPPTLDPKLLQLGMRLWQEYQGGDQRTAALLEALRPFLREKRRNRLDRAVQIARLSHVIRIALHALGEQREEESQV